MIVPKINAVLETALYVEDLERSVAFYKTIFEFEPISSSERLCALNVSNRQVLLLFLKGASSAAKVTSGGIIPPTDGDGELHLAFAIAASELEQWENWLDEKDIKIESKVKWSSVERAFTFETRTSTCWNSPRPDCGRYTNRF